MPHTKRKDKSLSIRFTPEERLLLERLSNGKSLASHIRSCVLDDQTSPRKSRRHEPDIDHVILASILAKLGATRQANNLNQIAHGINSGAVIALSENMESQILDACNDIKEMRRELLTALGSKVR